MPQWGTMVLVRPNGPCVRVLASLCTAVCGHGWDGGCPHCRAASKAEAPAAGLPLLTAVLWLLQHIHESETVHQSRQKQGKGSSSYGALRAAWAELRLGFQDVGRASEQELHWWQGLAVLSQHGEHLMAPPLPTQVLILSPAFLKYIHDNWTQHHGRYPSTGFTALLFALHACQQVSVSVPTGPGAAAVPSLLCLCMCAPAQCPAAMAFAAVCRSPCLASEQTPKGTGTTTGRKTAGPEPSAGQGFMTLTSNSASLRDWQLKAGFYSTDDAFPRD